MNYRVGIVTLFVRDLAAAREFYVAKLGFQVVEQASTDNFITLATADRCLIGLQQQAAPNRSSPGRLPDSLSEDELVGTPGSVELGPEVEDVDAVWRAWQASGVNLTSQPADLSFGRGFDARDPEGHRLSVFKFDR